MRKRSIFGSLQPGGVIPDLFIKLLPVQIVMMAIGSINSIIEGGGCSGGCGGCSGCHDEGGECGCGGDCGCGC